MPQQDILIVDDDRLLVDALSIRCSRLGLHVRSAFNASEAVMAINTSRPDLVCLDVNMPGPTGLDAAKMLSAMPGWHSIPIIIMTGRDDPDTIKRCHDMCAYYVKKSNNLWQRMEPLIRELLEIGDDTSEPPENFGSVVETRKTQAAPLTEPVAVKAAEPTSERAETVIHLPTLAATMLSLRIHTAHDACSSSKTKRRS